MAATDKMLVSLHNGQALSWMSSQCELLQLGSLTASLQFRSELESRPFSDRDTSVYAVLHTEISPKFAERGKLLRKADNTNVLMSWRFGRTHGLFQSKQACLDLKSPTISTAAKRREPARCGWLVAGGELTMPHGVSLRLGGGKPALSLVSCKV